MAILIEEEKEKNTSGWFSMLSVLIILVIIGIAVYYMFFVQPEIIDVVVPVKTGVIDELAKIDFDPKNIISSDFFAESSRKTIIPPVTLPPAGNTSPFGVF